MNGISVGQTQVNIQLGLFDSVIGLLSVGPVFLLGVLVLIFILARLFKGQDNVPKLKTAVSVFVLYYYFNIMFVNIVGIPSMREFVRLTRLEENIFNPVLNMIPFSDGIGFNFICNIILFIPLGFLCPVISSKYTCIKNILLIGAGVSLFIEFSQLFTLYRVTDINDFLTNTTGTVLGYLCFRLCANIPAVREKLSVSDKKGGAYTVWLPPVAAVTAFIAGFFS